MTATNVAQPVDGKGNVIDRAMGVPICVDDVKLGSNTKYVDIVDISDKGNRVFYGFSIENPTSTPIEIAMGENFATAKKIKVSANTYLTFDHLTYGPGIVDDSTGERVTKIRARLTTAQGTAATGTIDYSGSGNPSDGETVVINGVTYEFCDDESASDPDYVKVDIKASADLTWTEFVSVLNATEQAVTGTIDTGTDVVTITSNYGGDYGNSLTTVDGSTGATFSAGTLTGGTGTTVAPVIHVW